MHLALIWAAVFLAIVAARLTRLTSVLFFLCFGSLMANIGLISSGEDAFIAGLAELGIIVIMFALGFEESTSNFLNSIKKSWGIAFFGALAPFVTAFLIADYFWQDTNLALMCGLTMTATAVSLTMVSLRSEGLGKSVVATRIMTSAVLDDIASLALVAILVPIATGEASANLADIALIGGKAVGFFVIVTLVGAWVLPHDTPPWLKKVPLIGRYGMRHVLGIARGEFATLTVLLTALAVGLIAYDFGFHPAVGAYMAGLVIREEYFTRDDNTDSFRDTRRIADSAAFTWLGPVFFVDLGALLVFESDIFLSVIPQTAALTIGILLSQIISASVAARYTADVGWAASLMIGFGMLGRAELAFVVMNIAYVPHQIIGTETFYTLMFTTFWLNVAVPITICLWKPCYERAKTGARNDR